MLNPPVSSDISLSVIQGTSQQWYVPIIVDLYYDRVVNCTGHVVQKNPKIVMLPLGWIGRNGSSNLFKRFISYPPLPFFALCVPRIELGKAWVQDTSGSFICHIHLELCCKYQPFNTQTRLSTRWTPSQRWNDTMCMSRRWSYKDNTEGNLSLKSKPYILHKASSGVTYLASLYCLISSTFPSLSSLSACLTATDILSWPL